MSSGQPGILELNEPVYNGKQETCRQSAHQHTGNTFYWAYCAPYLFKKKIPRADCGIVGHGEIKCRLPGRNGHVDGKRFAIWSSRRSWCHYHFWQLWIA